METVTETMIKTPINDNNERRYGGYTKNSNIDIEGLYDENGPGEVMFFNVDTSDLKFMETILFKVGFYKEHGIPWKIIFYRKKNGHHKKISDLPWLEEIVLDNLVIIEGEEEKYWK